MKLVTILGTRPEIIRLARVIPLLDEHARQVLVFTGQNHDPALSEVFFRELGVRKPDLTWNARGSAAAQVAEVLVRTEEVLAREKPDRVVILGDTNSGLASFVAARMGVPVFHLEAGNRCFDERVPEEINRRLIDHASAILMPYTERSRENLLGEGIARERVFVTGNPIFEVLGHYGDEIERSDVMARLAVKPQSYLLATLHRAENVDEKARLASLFAGLARAADVTGAPVLVSVHPRTRDSLGRHGVTVDARVRLLEPLSFFDFIKLEKNAACVITDSGTVQEECCIFGVPNVTARDVTERPETVECGSNILAGADPDRMAAAVKLATGGSRRWTPPPEYLVPDVSRTVAKIVTGYHEVLRRP